MNLLHLRYAVEIAETNSMTQAAEKLYTAQPNLSRAIRELEGSLGITIFNRTSKGIYPTQQGEEFLGYARKVIAQVDDIKERYCGSGKKPTQFSISVPRASYISCAFTEFVKNSKLEKNAELIYRETNSFRAIDNLVNSDYKLGIIRYQLTYERNFKKMLKERELNSEIVYEFSYNLLFSSSSPLASKKEITQKDLAPLTEIAHADPFVPFLPDDVVKKNEFLDLADRHIYVFERGSQMDLLSSLPDTYMWVSPIPQRLRELYSLIQRLPQENDRKYRDVLIYKRDYTLSDTDKAFLDELIRIKKELSE